MRQYFRYRTKGGANFLAFKEADRLYQLGECDTIESFITGVFASKLAKPINQDWATFSASHQQIVPIIEPRNHLAVGLNYRSHIGETHLKAPVLPIIFPRTCHLSAWDENVEISHLSYGLIDYEVEWAIVLRKDFSLLDSQRICAGNADAYIAGVVLALDNTSREVQVRFAKARNVYYGFSRAKSFPTFAPVGPYFIRWQDFCDFSDFEITLTLNGKLRQQGTRGQMIYDPVAILQTIYHPTIAAQRYINQLDQDIPLLKDESLKAGDVILLGTPGGILFNAPNWRDKLTGLLVGLAKGKPIEGMKDYIIGKQPPHLNKGDRLTASGTRLGQISVSII